MTFEIGGPGRAPQRLGRHTTPLHHLGLHTPHLHRLSPGGETLATYDGNGQRIVVVDTGRGGGQHIVSIVGLPAIATEMRWLHDGRGLALIADDRLWRVPLDPSSPPASVHPLPVTLVGGHNRAVDDVRAVAGGLLVRSHDGGTQGWSVVRLAGDGEPPSAKDRVVPLHDRWPIGNATVDRDGRVVARVDSKTLPTAHDIVHIDVEAEPVEVARARCPTPSGRCVVTNWVPGATVPIFATAEGMIVHGSSAFDLTAASATGRSVHTLWASADESELLAATTHEVGLYDASGASRWTWSPASGRIVRAASLTPGGSVVVAVDLSLLEIRGGRARRIMSVPASRARADDIAEAASRTAEHFIDQLVALPHRRYAYSLVETYRFDNEHRRHSRVTRRRPDDWFSEP